MKNRDLYKLEMNEKDGVVTVIRTDNNYGVQGYVYSNGGVVKRYTPYQVPNYIIDESLRMLAKTLDRGNVDLRKCKRGDTLYSALGDKLFYVEPTQNDNYYDHLVRYDDNKLGDGTRTHAGYVFRKNRKPKTDHDIVIVKKRF